MFNDRRILDLFGIALPSAPGVWFNSIDGVIKIPLNRNSALLEDTARSGGSDGR